MEGPLQVALTWFFTFPASPLETLSCLLLCSSTCQSGYGTNPQTRLLRHRPLPETWQCTSPHNTPRLVGTQTVVSSPCSQLWDLCVCLWH